MAPYFSRYAERDTFGQNLIYNFKAVSEGGKDSLYDHLIQIMLMLSEMASSNWN